ncbi:TYROSYL tRNA SYNTHETASE [Encephalitozoon cuniculi GB-M1]|uniref:Probable tyrosine--tRNA ligase, cytoplasmic n=2 Tax=Encephalitozoon cuniculi TaxID=6035 RepID=SYYC_ENCCU|nr:tyrosine--tRNA ligase TYS1 [Encephalitozoon cuniculi GB-M1]Q8SRV7.1 RecName: Full=Probable tyrosine--tRNA ligase, cytoplasmic; AltName: Full=Tyrosyl-tRNA synthetase; Short=TyrRS [Encephalitozoon cuniculi GB-M1]AGE95416.1 tyrosyl tRNA synthetase [Encephalitozoon cuniculi]KMV66169.1 tyrosinyl-tRNA synthetase catalytic coredomain-containing protein [Encephalitozoon cuniculi EcunIII-L]CAD26632.1 TYROSYL tRNA SYNTHETASE [Encephalitozoon cuniculi GB-M1]
MSVEQKLYLITRNLQEILGEEELKRIVSERELNVYWGTAITGKPHIAYLVPLMKIKDFVDAGCNVKILFADIHGFLDNLKAPIEKVQHRCAYYEKLIKSALKMLCVDLDRIQFVKGSEFQKSERYTMDLYRILSITSKHDAKKAGAEVVRQVENPMVSSLVYPSMQALDEVHLSVDAQFGGVDQRKIFTYARKYLPLLNYEKRIHLMSPMLPGLNSDKMSSSDDLSKIDLMDSKEAIWRKIRKCFCEEGNKDNGLMMIFSHIVFPILQLKGECVRITDRDGREMAFEKYQEFEEEFVRKSIHPGDLKSNAARLIDEIIRPIREEMEKDLDMVREAYN